MGKVVFRNSYFNPVLQLYRNSPNDAFCKSVDWFLYNGNIDLKGKVDAWLIVNI